MLRDSAPRQAAGKGEGNIFKKTGTLSATYWGFGSLLLVEYAVLSLSTILREKELKEHHFGLPLHFHQL